MERNVVPDVVQAHPGDCLDERGREAEAQVQRQSDVARRDQTGWDASDAARLDVVADAAHQPPSLPEDVDAGKSAVPVRGDQAQGDPVQDDQIWGDRVQAACRRALLPAHWAEVVPGAAAAPCTQGAGRSEEQSCAEQASSAELRRVELDAADFEPSEPQAAPKQ